LAHVCCASDNGPLCVVDYVRRTQPAQSSFLLPSLFSSFFSMKPMAPLEVIQALYSSKPRILLSLIKKIYF
jgi:hypothetical protein